MELALFILSWLKAFVIPGEVISLFASSANTFCNFFSAWRTSSFVNPSNSSSCKYYKYKIFHWSQREIWIILWRELFALCKNQKLYSIYMQMLSCVQAHSTVFLLDGVFYNENKFSIMLVSFFCVSDLTVYQFLQKCIFKSTVDILFKFISKIWLILSLLLFYSIL